MRQSLVALLIGSSVFGSGLINPLPLYAVNLGKCQSEARELVQTGMGIGSGRSPIDALSLHFFSKRNYDSNYMKCLEKSVRAQSKGSVELIKVSEDDAVYIYGLKIIRKTDT